MALAFIEHWNEKQTVVDDVFAAARDAEANRQREYDAAVLIQAVIRGVRLRQFIKYLHMCANRVQMAWRGYLGRQAYHRKLAAKVEERQLNYYESMATKIKKVWKGHYVRKHVYDYYAMKTYLIALQEKNAIVREKLSYYEKDIRERKELEEELENLSKHNNFARSCHYMLSTQVKPGVFNKLGKDSAFETHVENVFPRDLSSKKNTWHKIGKIPSPPLELPPLKKVQGPFKTPATVYLQRHKPLRPSLKVQTSFISEETAREKEKQEEWCKRVIDDEFSPFTRMTYEYIPSLHNSTKCESIAYGTKTFREIPEKLVSGQPFKTVFSRIPEFDQLGESYS